MLTPTELDIIHDWIDGNPSNYDPVTVIRSLFGEVQDLEQTKQHLIIERDEETERLSDEIEVLTTERDGLKALVSRITDEAIDYQNELDTLTIERDNALLRIEELEGEVEAWAFDGTDRPGGGVNPNA